MCWTGSIFVFLPHSFDECRKCLNFYNGYYFKVFHSRYCKKHKVRSLSIFRGWEQPPRKWKNLNVRIKSNPENQRKPHGASIILHVSPIKQYFSCQVISLWINSQLYSFQVTCLHIKSIEKQEWTHRGTNLYSIGGVMKVVSVKNVFIWAYCEAAWLHFMNIQRWEKWRGVWGKITVRSGVTCKFWLVWVQ